MNYQQLSGLDLETLRRRVAGLTEEIIAPAVQSAVAVIDRDTDEREITVPAFERSRTFYSIDKQGQRVPVGTASRREYDADRKVAYATMRGQDDHDYRIGQISQVWELLDHESVIRPLLDNGFRNVQLLNHRSGGTSVLAMLSNPDIRLKDVIGWDQHLFADRMPYSNTGHFAGSDHRPAPDLEFGVRVDSSIAYGTAIKITYGFWRILCQNGMMTNVLGLGGHTFGHRSFFGQDGSVAGPLEIEMRIGRLTEDFDQAHGDILQLPSQQSRIETKALDWPIEILKRVAEDGTASLSDLPDFARLPFEQLINRMPTWSPPTLLKVLEAARQDDRIGTFDIVNAISNVASLQPTHVEARMHGDPSWTIYDRLTPLSQSLKDVIDIGAFKGDIEWGKN